MDYKYQFVRETQLFSSMYILRQCAFVLVVVLVIAKPGQALTVQNFVNWANDMRQENLWNMGRSVVAFVALFDNVNQMNDNNDNLNWVQRCETPTHMLLGKYWNIDQFPTPGSFILEADYEIKRFDQTTAEEWRNEKYPGAKRNDELPQRRTLLALWSRRCVLTRAYVIKGKAKGKFYFPHYEEVLAAYWRHFLNPRLYDLPEYNVNDTPYYKWIMIYSSKKPCDYGGTDSDSVRGCSRFMADLFLARPQTVGTLLQKTAFQTVYISDLTVQTDRYTSSTRDHTYGLQCIGYVNWKSTSANTENELKFSHDGLGNGLLNQHLYVENGRPEFQGYDEFFNILMSSLAENVMTQNIN